MGSMGSNGGGHLSAAALTQDGWLYFSGALTPYDVETLYDQIATLRRHTAGDVQIEVELGGTRSDSPELHALAHRMKRLRRQGITVRFHAARGRRRPV